MSFKFNAFTGNFDIVKADNFSFNNIPLGKTVKIPTNQQMIVYENMTISGDLIIEGELVLFDEKKLYRIKDTNISESINVNGYELIRQTASGITTSLSGVSTGSVVHITNRGGGDNTLNITVQGSASPTITDLETFSLVYNGTDYDFI